MPLCTAYNPRNAHASPVRTKTNGKGRRATRSAGNTSAVVPVPGQGKEIGAIIAPVVLKEAEANVDLGVGGGSDEENVKPRGVVVGMGGQGKMSGSAVAGPLVSLTNTEESAGVKADEEEKGDDHNDDDNDGEGEWRDKEGLAFEHARQRARKAGERAKRRARKAEMQAVAMAFVSPIIDGQVRKEVVVEVKEDNSKADGGHGLHKGSRVGKVGMRKADAAYLDMADVDLGAVDGYFKRAQERLRSLSTDGVIVDFNADQGRREVSLSELVYFATQKKPKKNKGHDFEMIPALKTVIVLDDVESDMSMDEAWDHIEDLSVDGGEELSYAKVVAGCN